MRSIGTYLALTSITALAACGSSGSSSSGSGSGGDDVEVAQASTGYAVAGETDPAGVAFTKSSVPLIGAFGEFSEAIDAGLSAPTEDSDISVDDIRLAPQAITIAVSDDLESIVLTVDGVDYTATLSDEVGLFDGFDSAYTFEDGDAGIYLNTSTISDSAEMVFITAATDEQILTGFDTFGFDTDPTVIDAVTGTATYDGQITLYTVSSFEDGLGTQIDGDALSGDITLTADFDGNAISGDAVFTEEVFDTDTSDFVTVSDNLTFEAAAIDGNGFSGTVSDDGEFFGDGVTLQDVTYNGNFYGAEGETVGGNLSGTIGNSEMSAPLQGAFGANASSGDE